MNEAGLKEVLKLYGFQFLDGHTPQKGYRNTSYPVTTIDGQRLNFILYKNEPEIAARIRRANAVADFLYSVGLAVRSTADDRIVRIATVRGERYGALYTYLPGGTIPWEGYTRKHLKLLGRTLSDMHAAVALMPSISLPYVADEYIAVFEQMQNYFDRPGVNEALLQKLGVSINPAVFRGFLRLLEFCRELPGQPLHMDFVRGNILFADNPLRITGVLDFEKTAFGSPLFDIARTLAFLTVDCKYKTATEVQKHFLVNGYIRTGKAHFTDIRPRNAKSSVLQALITLFVLHDFYKFLRHNPYEYLPHNAHFIRTQALLLDRGIMVRAKQVLLARPNKFKMVT